MAFALDLVIAAAQAIAIIDGDTLRIDDERVRLLGVDAPEIHRAACEKERRLGEAAKAELERLLKGQALRLERHGRDRYRRTLAIVFAGQTDLNAAIIASGHAVPWDGSKHDWCE